MFKEFKDFISKGNVFDMAVGIIIGGAFGKIVASLVNDVLMPIIGLILGGVNFTELKWVFKAGDEAAKIPEAALYYGKFIQNIVDFIIIAFTIFLLVKFINKLKKPKAPVVAEVKVDEKLELLKEINQNLKNLKG